MKNQVKTALKKYGMLYLLIISVVFILRFFCYVNDSDALTWILAPTARWAGILGGIPFEYLPHQGYVNHFYRFLIAPSCSGIRFMIITFLMLACSFLYRIRSARAGYLWFAFSAVFSYFFTVLVNGIRIVLAIYLPVLLNPVLQPDGILNGWLNPDRLHTLIGTVVYFSSLCVIYPVAFLLFQRGFMKPDEYAKPSFAGSKYGKRLLIPAFWYLSAIIIIPFCGRILKSNWEGFASYSILVIGACIAVSILIAIAYIVFVIATLIFRK